MLRSFRPLPPGKAEKQKMSKDAALNKARQEFYKGPLQYVRVEVSLLRGFSTFPGIETPSPLPGNKSRIFELRTYES